MMQTPVEGELFVTVVEGVLPRLPTAGPVSERAEVVLASTAAAYSTLRPRCRESRCLT